VRISTKGRYAVRALTDLACHSKNKPLSLSAISGRQKISLYYLEQLFVKMRRAGLVKSVRGPGGGYRLAKDANEISVWDVLSAVGEKMYLVDCLQDRDDICDMIDTCVTRLIWKKLGDKIGDELKQITLKKLCCEKKRIDKKQ
jgi:Rrf2 family iron-sulfur cluster assembly transcriptional regulator